MAFYPWFSQQNIQDPHRKLAIQQRQRSLLHRHQRKRLQTLQLRHQAKNRAVTLQRGEDRGPPNQKLPFLATGQEHQQNHQHKKVREVFAHYRNTKLISSFYYIIAIRCRPSGCRCTRSCWTSFHLDSASQSWPGMPFMACSHGWVRVRFGLARRSWWIHLRLNLQGRSMHRWRASPSDPLAYVGCDHLNLQK